MIRTIALAVALLLGACSTTPKVEVVATTVDKPTPPIPEMCRADGLRPFKPVEKRAGDQTEAKALAHALRSNHTRMVTNATRVAGCECSILDAQNPKNADDYKRLQARCADPSAQTTSPTSTAG